MIMFTVWRNSQETFMALLMWQNRKALAVNVAIIVFLTLYTLLGGVVFLHFERGYQEYLRKNETLAKTRCIEEILLRNRHQQRVIREADFAREIAEKCILEIGMDPKHEWSYKTAALYGFGILTTLGYGKIEPKTTNGRIFAVIYGFLGIPITVILLTNIGRYLESLALRVRNMCRKKKQDMDGDDSISTTILFCIVVIYLTLGALCIPLLNGRFDFFNGIYFAFICLTAIEYGDLVPHNDYFVPIVLVYVCIGLAISTIALDIGSMYVRKLHYIGQKLRNIANIRIWFGSKDLRISEFVSAVGANIGIEESVLCDIDLDNLVKMAIQVKEGRLSRVPQTHMIVEGIWPPALVPLFIKDGQFPTYVDQDDYRDSIHQLPYKKKSVVRFEDEVLSTETLTEVSSRQHSRLSPIPTSDSDMAQRIPPPGGLTTSQVTTNSTSLLSDRRHYGKNEARDKRGGSPDLIDDDSVDVSTSEMLVHESASFDTSVGSSLPGHSPSAQSRPMTSFDTLPQANPIAKPPRKSTPFFKGRPLRLWQKKKNVSYRAPPADSSDQETQESLLSRQQSRSSPEPDDEDERDGRRRLHEPDHRTPIGSPPPLDINLLDDIEDVDSSP